MTHQDPAFTAKGRFWRGNLHTHSRLSDGALPPDKVAEAYRSAGYDFLVLSDHFLERYKWPIADTRAFRTEGFTTIIALVLAPHYSSYSIGQYLDRARAAAEPHGIEVAGIDSWAVEPAYVAFIAADLQAKLAALMRKHGVQLYINGLYRGLYVSVEHVDDEFLEKNFRLGGKVVRMKKEKSFKPFSRVLAR